jgi:5-methylcytosine-specific restriction endonuclease McrA
MPRKDRAEYNAYHRDYQLRRYHVRRVAAVEMLGGKCVRCGATSDLQFDHIDRRTKEFKIGDWWSVAYDKFLAEVKKCQILCFPCHIKKTVEEKDYLPLGP